MSGYKDTKIVEMIIERCESIINEQDELLRQYWSFSAVGREATGVQKCAVDIKCYAESLLKQFEAERNDT